MTNGLSHPYQLDGSTLISRVIRRIFFFIFISFLMKFLEANRIAPDGTPRFAASQLGLYCLPTCMSHKKDDRLIWVNMTCIFS